MAAKASCQVTIADITDAYSAVLTSETYTFMGNTSGAPIGSACTTQAMAYQGNIRCSKVTIGTISCPTGISASVSNNGTASPTITFKTTAVISVACEASVPVIVDGVTIYKKFSFAVANQGAGFGWNIAKNTAELPIGTGTWESGTWRLSGTGTIKNVTLPDSPLNNLTKGILITRINTSDQIGFCQDKYAGLLKGEAYTVSAWVKCSEKMAVKLQTYWTGDDSSGISQSMTVEANKWTHLSFTSEPSSSSSRSIAYIYSQGGSVGATMYVCGVKLEKGTKATEWTPHPDDLVGDTGKGIKSTAITYQASTSGTTVPTGTWSGSIPTVSSGQYLWVRTIFSYSDDTTSTIYSVSRMGTNGANGTNGKSIGSVVNYYLATASSSGVTTATSGWTTAVQSVSAAKKYLWNYEVVKYTDGTVASTTAPCIIGSYGDRGSKGDKGDTGSTGNGIKSITEHYAVSTSNSTVPTSWSSTVPTMTESNKYLWNYETITYTNGTTVDTTKRVIGVYGNKGATGATGSQGYSLVANVVRDAFTESRWTIYGTINHEETWSSTSGIRNGCRIGDMFAIVGTATDTKNAHVAYYRSNTASGDLKGLCISHTIIPRGATGATGSKGDKGATGATGPQGPQGAAGKDANQVVHTVNGNGESNLYVEFATIKITGSYANHPTTFKLGGRGFETTDVQFSFISANNSDPGLDFLRSSGGWSLWIYKKTTSTWGLITRLNELYGQLRVFNYTQGSGPYTVTWTSTKLASLPSGSINANPLQAAKTATNFMQFTDGTGLEVGNKTSGSWSGYRTKISASAFEILNRAGTTLAYYGDKLIQLGKNAKDAVIELCGGVGKILVETKSGNAALSIQSEYVDIKGVHESVLETSSSSGSCIAGAVDDSFVVNTYSDANNKANFDIGNGSIILESKKKGYQAEVEFYGCGWSGGVYTGAFAPTKAYSEKIMLGDSGRVWERLIVKNSPQVTSDRRAKTNIFPLGESKINKTDIHSELFDRLKPVQYRMIDGDGRICYGFVAQDVVEAMRELGIREDELDLVHHDRKNTEDGYIDTYSMVYTNLIAVITHELQLEKERRSNLEIEVADLRSELESMRDNISGDTN